MSQPEDRLSKDKRRADTYWAWIRDIAIVLLCVVIAWGIYDWRHSDNKRQAIYDDLGAAAASLKNVGVNADATTRELPAAVKEFKGVATQLSTFIKDQNTETSETQQALRSRLITLDGLLSEFRVQVKQEGDSANEVLQGGKITLASLNMAIIDADDTVVGLGDHAGMILDTFNSRTQKVLDDFDIVMMDENGGLKGLVKRGNLTMDQVLAIATNVNKTTADIQKKTNDVLFPKPQAPCPKGVKGIGCHIKRYGLVSLKFIKEFGGAAFLVERIYFGLP